MQDAPFFVFGERVVRVSGTILYSHTPPRYGHRTLASGRNDAETNKKTHTPIWRLKWLLTEGKNICVCNHHVLLFFPPRRKKTITGRFRASRRAGEPFKGGFFCPYFTSHSSMFLFNFVSVRCNMTQWQTETSN